MLTTAPATVAFDYLGMISAFGTVVALLGVIASIWIARRGQKQDLSIAVLAAERAERAQESGAASAERAENAAALTIDSMTRMAVALDRIADTGLDISANRAVPATVRVAWALTYLQGDQYSLTNVGDGAAHHVQISAHESLLQVGDWSRVDCIRPREAMTFHALRSMATTDSTITVEWAATLEGDMAEQWRYPLPPRPPRR